MIRQHYMERETLHPLLTDSLLLGLVISSPGPSIWPVEINTTEGAPQPPDWKQKPYLHSDCGDYIDPRIQSPRPSLPE